MAEQTSPETKMIKLKVNACFNTSSLHHRGKATSSGKTQSTMIQRTRQTPHPVCGHTYTPALLTIPITSGEPETDREVGDSSLGVVSTPVSSVPSGASRLAEPSSHHSPRAATQVGLVTPVCRRELNARTQAWQPGTQHSSRTKKSGRKALATPGLGMPLFLAEGLAFHSHFKAALPWKPEEHSTRP